MAGKSFGLSLDDKIFTRALKFLKSQRTPAGTYVYSLSHSFYPGRPINRHTGSLARTPACDYAIRLWEPEDISLRQLVDGLDRLRDGITVKVAATVETPKAEAVE